MIPKSLHTVTVFVNVAKVFMQVGQYPASVALDMAVASLGYHETTDVYALKAQALKKLQK